MIIMMIIMMRIMMMIMTSFLFGRANGFLNPGPYPWAINVASEPTGSEIKI